ncbi:hypothetical protein [Pedobacter cryophilus]|uniref:Uncharacterized protein n=1 Tax=Pedobacter cryophilus TaxID=2571271 RepID=A0A4U1C4T5_9SPHI|nr:hypothetical protein [Pedobacter cryophilus]TKC00275.1 hypothetical protein FA046_00925 [Pedobacter cryophilus]
MEVNLVGTAPNKVLIHGPSKLLVNEYNWHDPNHGIVASYTPTAFDVKDHFGVFRGVDMIESFAQATSGSCAEFLTRLKRGDDTSKTHSDFIPTFISVGGVNFHSYLLEGDTFISMGKIMFFKFRQIVIDGRVYKVPAGLDLNAHFKDFTTEKLNNYEIDDSFTLVAELFGITGRAIKRK